MSDEYRVSLGGQPERGHPSSASRTEGPRGRGRFWSWGEAGKGLLMGVTIGMVVGIIPILPTVFQEQVTDAARLNWVREVADAGVLGAIVGGARPFRNALSVGTRILHRAFRSHPITSQT